MSGIEEPSFTEVKPKVVLQHLVWLKIFDDNVEIHQPHILHKAIR